MPETDVRIPDGVAGESRFATMDEIYQIEHQTVSLLHLPPEIRNKIYLLLLGGKTREHRLPADSKVLQPALSRTCRLLRNEMLPMFYGDCVFEAGNPWQLFKFLKPLGLGSLRKLRDVRIASPFHGKAGLQQARANLRYLLEDYGRGQLQDGVAKVALQVESGEQRAKEVVWITTVDELRYFDVEKRTGRNGRAEGFIVRKDVG